MPLFFVSILFFLFLMLFITLRPFYLLSFRKLFHYDLQFSISIQSLIALFRSFSLFLSFSNASCLSLYLLLMAVLVFLSFPLLIPHFLSFFLYPSFFSFAAKRVLQKNVGEGDNCIADIYLARLHLKHWKEFHLFLSPRLKACSQNKNIFSPV